MIRALFLMALASASLLNGCARQGEYQEEMALAANPGESSKFKVWKTIKLGVCASTDEYHKAIRAADMKIGFHARELLGKRAFTTASKKREVKLVKLTLPELDLPNGALLEEIYARAKEQGLDVCPAEVGPALRLAYEDQPDGEWLIIAMEPISDLGVGGGPPDRILFEVGRVCGTLWLDNRYGRPVPWTPEHQWIFVSK